MKRILIVAALLLAPVLAFAAPARAGGWAVTYLDPVPGKIRPQTPYVLGFWMLQHGTHPYEGADLGEVGLRFTQGKKSIDFPGVELREPAHYAVAVSLPRGTWKVEAVQGWFSPYEIGTVTVPGSLKVRPVPADLRRAIDAQEPQEDYWGDIRPPGIPPSGIAPPARSTGGPATPSASPAAAPPGRTAGASGTGDAGAAVTTASVESGAESGSGWPAPYGVAVAAGLALLGAAVLVLRARRR
ncbi:hypothetical protein AB0D67_21705 [Streptosporangium sp. NPDC048047]|uniref:hypothetical protein n=1 Tax=Streptosporangium sp. NPDC048047 TaxID=3155748 RepID=UPI00343C300D